MRPGLQQTVLILAISAGAFAAPPVQKLRGIDVFSSGEATRIVIETGGKTQFTSGELHNPERIYFDLENTSPGALDRTVNGVGPVQKVRMALTRRATTRVVMDLTQAADFKAMQAVNPPRLVIVVRARGAAQPLSTDAATVTLDRSAKVPKVALKKFKLPPPRPPVKTPLIAPPRIEVGHLAPEVWLARLEPPSGWAMPLALPPPPKSRKTTAIASARKPAKAPAKPSERSKPELAKVEAPRLNGMLLPDHQDPPIGEPAHGAETTLTRALGLKLRRVVLDAGHGGKDVGTISPHGMYEKDLVLDVTRRLGKLIEDRLGSEVVYTRADDTFIPLGERTAIANREHADLFLSIHANSSRTASVAGFETYYLNVNATRADMDVAARENASSEKSIADLTDLVRQIMLNDKLDESRQFAAHVHDATYPLALKTVGKVRDRGVKKAPFMVLVGARMPSVLVEIGFMTNPTEETQMRKPEYRQKVAEALFQGVSGYADTLSHFAVAANANTAVALDAGN